MEFMLKFKSNGATYYLKKNVVTDIDVEPGIKTVYLLDEFGDQCTDVGCEFNIKKNKSFPDVEELVISENVFDIFIPNMLFPNVRHVTSKSSYFVDDTNCLIGIHENCCIGKRTLLNSFCKKPGELVSLKNVSYINDNALLGCQTSNFVSIENIIVSSMRNSGFDVKDISKGVKMFGQALIGVDPDAEIIEIPDDRFPNIRVMQEYIDFTNKNKYIKVHKAETLCKFFGLNIPERIIIENCNDKDLSVYLSEFQIECLEIIDDSKLYTIIDGALYSKDGTVLVKYPDCRKGKVVIPDGVIKIVDKAFQRCSINSVSMPDSLRYIGRSAFGYCQQLEEVNFNNNLEFMNVDAFIGCEKLKQIDIPDNIKVISEGCFSKCPLETIKLPSNLQVIGVEAFDAAKGSIILPKSVSFVDKYNFRKVDVITIEGNIPAGLISSISVAGMNDCNITEIKTPNGSFYLPKMLSAIDDNLCMCPIEDIQPYIYKKLMAKTPQEEEVVLGLYEKTKDMSVGNILKKISNKMIKRLILENDEDILIRTIKTGLLNYQQLQHILNKCESASVSAYVLEQMNTISKEDDFNV